MSLCTSIEATRSCITFTRHLLKRHIELNREHSAPPDGTPHINQETDTRARSGSGHDPQRGPQHQTLSRPRTVRSEPVTTDGTPPPACTFHTAATRRNHRKPRADPSPPPISSRASRHEVAHLFLCPGWPERQNHCGTRARPPLPTVGATGPGAEVPP